MLVHLQQCGPHTSLPAIFCSLCNILDELQLLMSGDRLFFIFCIMFHGDMAMQTHSGFCAAAGWFPTFPTKCPQCCILSSLPYSLQTYSCTSSHQSAKFLKFADATTLIGLTSDGDESAYKWEIGHLVPWCGQKNLELSVLKTMEMIIDFRRSSTTSSPSPCLTFQ